MDKAYRAACKLGQVQLGKLWLWRQVMMGTAVGPWVICFPTKQHWGDKSEYPDIANGLYALREFLWDCSEKDVVALPAVGCGLGGLEWKHVRNQVEFILRSVKADIRLYIPGA